MAKKRQRGKKTKATQTISKMKEDERAMELVAAMLAQKSADTRIPVDYTIDVGFIAQVPFIIV